MECFTSVFISLNQPKTQIHSQINKKLSFLSIINIDKIFNLVLAFLQLIASQMKSPVVFIFNIRRSVYEAFGTAHFNQIKNKYKNIHFLPIINNLDESIQQRAQKISKKLPLLLQKLNAQQSHLISYSVSGLDARFALSCLNSAQYVKSLTTIATPHKGSRTANFSQRNFFTRPQIEPVARLLGIGIKPFHETVPENIKHFNEQVRDVDNIDYFSMGAERLPNNCSNSLKEIGNYLRLNTQRNFTYENDGVFGYDEIEWGEHLANFDADHSQVVGISGTLNRLQTFDLALENIQSTEQSQKTASS